MAKRRARKSGKARKVHVKKHLCRWKAPGMKKNGKFTKC